MTPAEIAKKLTPAQKRFLAEAAKDGTAFEGYMPAVKLVQLGLATEKPIGIVNSRWPLTPLGRAVLAELEGK